MFGISRAQGQCGKKNRVERERDRMGSSSDKNVIMLTVLPCAKSHI